MFLSAWINSPPGKEKHQEKEITRGHKSRDVLKLQLSLEHLSIHFGLENEF